MSTYILTPLADYARQRGISRQRIYVIKDRLKLIDLPVYADLNGMKIPLYKDRKPLIQTFVQQDREQLQADIRELNTQIRNCAGCDINRLKAMRKEIETILK